MARKGEDYGSRSQETPGEQDAVTGAQAANGPEENSESYQNEAETLLQLKVLEHSSFLQEMKNRYANSAEGSEERRFNLHLVETALSKATGKELDTENPDRKTLEYSREVYLDKMSLEQAYRNLLNQEGASKEGASEPPAVSSYAPDPAGEQKEQEDWKNAPGNGPEDGREDGPEDYLEWEDAVQAIYDLIGGALETASNDRLQATGERDAQNSESQQAGYGKAEPTGGESQAQSDGTQEPRETPENSHPSQAGPEPEDRQQSYAPERTTYGSPKDEWQEAVWQQNALSYGLSPEEKSFLSAVSARMEGYTHGRYHFERRNGLDQLFTGNSKRPDVAGRCIESYLSAYSDAFSGDPDETKALARWLATSCRGTEKQQKALAEQFEYALERMPLGAKPGEAEFNDAAQDFRAIVDMHKANTGHAGKKDGEGPGANHWKKLGELTENAERGELIIRGAKARSERAVEEAREKIEHGNIFEKAAGASQLAYHKTWGEAGKALTIWNKGKEMRAVADSAQLEYLDRAEQEDEKAREKALEAELKYLEQKPEKDKAREEFQLQDEAYRETMEQYSLSDWAEREKIKEAWKERVQAEKELERASLESKRLEREAGKAAEQVEKNERAKKRALESRSSKKAGLSYEHA